MSPIRITLLVLLLCVSQQSFSQEKKPFVRKSHRHGFYFYWGYNRSFYSKSNVHFYGPNYDVTFYHLTASDRPSSVNMDYVNPTKMSIPQFNYRLGYYLTDQIAISVGMDHMKYVVDQNQMTTMSGIVTESASTLYAGTYLNKPIQLTPDVLTFEHTNGFNLFSLDFEYLPHLFTIQKLKLSTYLNTGLGGIWLVTKTDVRVFGDGLDNDFHLAGYTLTGKVGPRIEYNNVVFLAGEIKGGYCSLPSVLVKNSAPERGDHNLTFGEYYIVLGVRFKFHQKVEKETAH